MGRLILAERNRVASIMTSVADSDLSDVYSVLAHLEGMYPGFRLWYFSKVVTGVRNRQRQVFAAYAGSQIIGVAIAKRSAWERKLCTLWVEPEARSSGIADRLAESTFGWIGTRQPLFTVPEERLSEFARLINLWNFTEIERVVGLYRFQKIEYVFNGRLRPELDG